MKLLLTSGGITNTSIHDALVDLLGKPIAECHALCIPTAQWGHPMCGPASVRGFIAAEPDFRHLSGLGWASLGVLELTALPTIGAERWVPWIREADVLLVDGGDATYLCHWMRESGLADLLPSLTDIVWVGVSAGSMVMTPRIGAYFVEWPSAPNDRTLGVVDFSIFPHLDAFPTNTLADAERWATDLGVPAYAIDEQTAIKVVGGTAEVVSEGHWKRFMPQCETNQKPPTTASPEITGIMHPVSLRSRGGQPDGWDAQRSCAWAGRWSQRTAASPDLRYASQSRLSPSIT